MPKNKIRSTTVLCVRKNGKVAIGGDGQVSMGNTVMKNTAKKSEGFTTEKFFPALPARPRMRLLSSNCSKRRFKNSEEVFPEARWNLQENGERIECFEDSRRF